ncbi:cytochrome c family protein [Magnetovibrio sp.]|uniref:c-type cytochrome n=1 Tax=Magnetovibrio sp. TaxID=2024836 RepID=UPI002F93D8A4
MIKNVLGAILFTLAVFAFVNYVGDMAIPKHGTSEPQVAEETTEPAMEPAPEPAPAPEPTPEPAAEPAPAPAAEPVAEATPEPAPAPAPTEPVAEIAAVAAGGDAESGKSLFRKKCMSCHTFDKGGKDRTGPNLWGIVGRNKAASETFRYSKTLTMFGGTWTEAEINSFIAGPRTFVPDTKMTFAGLKDAKDRANVLAFLKTLAD